MTAARNILQALSGQRPDGGINQIGFHEGCA